MLWGSLLDGKYQSLMSFVCLPAQGARPLILGPDRGKRDIRVRVKVKGGRVRDERAYRYWYWYC